MRLMRYVIFAMCSVTGSSQGSLREPGPGLVHVCAHCLVIVTPLISMSFVVVSAGHWSWRQPCCGQYHLGGRVTTPSRLEDALGRVRLP